MEMFIRISGLQKLMKMDTTLWDTFLAALGEIVGTAILILMGCMGCVGSMGIIPSPIQIALTFGVAVMIAIQARNIFKKSILSIRLLSRTVERDIIRGRYALH